MHDSDLQAQLQHASERLAEYRSAIADAVQLLGHVGDDPVDLRDAIGQLSRLVAGEDLDATDLQGLAEDMRQGLWHRDRARMLLDAARAQYQRRTAERDIALARVQELAGRSVEGLFMSMLWDVTDANPPRYDIASWLLWFVVNEAKDHPTINLIVVLRMTWICQAHVKDWTIARSIVYEALVARGEDPTKVLAGLYGDDPCES